MTVCIPPEYIDKVKEIAYNTKLSSFEREKAFQQIMGDSAKELNVAYEKSLQLKNQLTALDRFVNSMTDVGLKKKQELKENIRANIERKNGVIYDKDLQAIIRDTIERKHDIKLTDAEGEQLFKLKKTVNEAEKLPTLPNGNKDPRYGAAVDDLSEFMGALKNPDDKLKFSELVKKGAQDFKQGFKDSNGAFQKGAFVVGKALNFLGSAAWKPLKASIDASFIGNQGIAIATRNPVLFKESVAKSIKAFTNKDAIKAFRIDLFSRARYDDAIASGLRILKPEEQFSSSIVEKLPLGIGRLVKGSDDAFSLFLQNARMGEFERVLKNTEKQLGRKLDSNVPADLKILKELGDHANKVTGTANLGYFEKNAPDINKVLFAGRYMASDIKQFTDLLDPRLSAEARKRAWATTALNAGGLYGAYLTYSMLNPDKTEINPNNANFMKVKVGNIWVGPKLKGQWMVQLIAKMIEGKEVNSSGKVTVYGKGYKPKTISDVLLHTARTKLAPVPSVIADITTGRDLNYDKATPLNEIKNLAAPISVGNIIDRMIKNKDPFWTQAQLDFYDALGISAYETSSR